MIDIIIAGAVGFVIGGFVGMFLMGLMIAVRDRDKD